MNVIKHFLSLDMHEAQVRQIINVRKMDSAHRLIITLNESSTKYIFSDDETAQFIWQTGSGEEVNDVLAEIINDAVIVDLPQAACAEAGEKLCQIRLYGAGGNLLAAPGFRLNIIDRVPCIEEETTDPAELTSTYGQIVALLAELEDAKTQLDDYIEQITELLNSMIPITPAELDAICV